MKALFKQLITNYKKKSEKYQSNEPISKELQQLIYHECTKADDHIGELLSLICNDCNKLCCCICTETEHKGHIIKPLKSLLRTFTQASNDSLKQQEIPFSKDELLSHLLNSQTEVLKKLMSMKEKVILEIESLELDISVLFKGLMKQVDQKQIGVIDVHGLLSQVYEAQENLEKFEQNLIQLIKQVPQTSEGIQNQIKLPEQNQIIGVILNLQKECISSLDQVHQQSSKQIDVCRLSFKRSIDLFNPYRLFSFNPTTKHQSLQIVENNYIKSASNSNGYKFAVLTPSLGENTGQIVKFGFSMKEVNTQNWIAVGMCHLKTIENKQFTFGFSNLGHGAYMVSSNGGKGNHLKQFIGSWSNINKAANNIVKAFKFGKGDQIYCIYDLSAKTITFIKNHSSVSKAQQTDVYALEFETSTEPLHPCALFYYYNDEVEFIQPQDIID